MKGDKYKGRWLQGEMHGKGIKSQKDGSIIKGIHEIGIIDQKISHQIFLFQNSLDKLQLNVFSDFDCYFSEKVNGSSC